VVQYVLREMYMLRVVNEHRGDGHTAIRLAALGLRFRVEYARSRREMVSWCPGL
jgi:hypothetical protein